MIPADPEELDLLAGEYVLGTLEAREAEAVARALPDHAALRAAVAAWEERLAPLLALVPAEAPPEGLWPRIEASLDAPGATVHAFPARRPPAFWRAWGIGMTAVAAGLAAFILFNPAPPPRLMTVLLSGQDQSAWVVEAEGQGLRLAALNDRPPVASGRVRQLWALPPGATTPVSLGLIRGDRADVSPGIIRPEPGMLIEITLEPEGGSPTGRPTGPVLFIGRLAPARSS